MKVSVEVKGGGNTGEITRIGQFITAPYAYDEVGVVDLDADNVAENLFKPRVGKRLVVTGCVVSAKRNIATDVDIEIYEATTDTETTVVESILKLDMPKSTSLPLFPLNLLITEGAFVNAKADDSNVLISLFGYFVPASA